jgi:hypothetical protein
MSLILLGNQYHQINQMEMLLIFKTKVYSKDRAPLKALSAKIINYRQFNSQLVLINPLIWIFRILIIVLLSNKLICNLTILEKAQAQIKK